MTTDNTEHIDWQQINRLPAFDIYKLVLLSLGRDCYTNVVHPFGCPVIHGDGIQRPEPDADYTDRLIVAIENARYGRLPTTGETACFTTTRTTTKIQFVGPGGFKVHSDEPEVIPSKFDLSAPPFDAQFWIVDTAEFRRFCDLMEWSAPPEFLPLGYKKPTVPHPLSEIPPGAPVELADDAPVPMADAPNETSKPRRRDRKPSWVTVALPYLRELCVSGSYRSSAQLYKAVCSRAGELGSPFTMTKSGLYCSKAGTTVADGTFGKIWNQIRAE